MAVRIEVQVGEAIAELRAALDRVTDLSPVMGGPINASVDSVLKRQFQSEGAAYSGKWAPLKPVTLQLRKRRGHGRGGIGRDTNRMWSSLTKLGLGPEAVKVVTKDSLTRGTTVPYARWFHGGYLSKTFVVADRNNNPVPLRRKIPKRVPARPIIPDPWPREVTGAWEKFIARYIEAGRARGA
jgi:hypothetical protein